MYSRRISNFLSILLFTAQLLATGLVSADDLFPLSSSSNVLGKTVEFLPVEEAYQLNAHTDNQQLFFEWTLKPGYYLYQHSFKFLNPDGSRLNIPSESFPKYKPGKRIYDEFYEKELEVYYHQTSFDIPLSLTTTKNADTTKLMVESQACADAGLCYPPRRQLLTISNKTSAVAVNEADNLKPEINNLGALPTNQQPLILNSLLLMLLFALLGGAILNLMPCVFPVLSIKALSLTTNHLSKHGKHLHGLAYTLGIVLSFMAIAALLMALRSAGEAIGWGFQLQSPLFVGLLVYLFVLMGLSFSGLLTLVQA